MAIYMKLYIDDRERSIFSRLVETKAKKKGIKIVKKRIEVGDYVLGDICFEAKSVKDFMASVINKRIWTQIDNMDRCFSRNFIMIYGSIEEALTLGTHITSFENIPKESRKVILENKFRGAVGRIRLDTDVQVIWTRNEREAAEELITLAKMAPIERNVIKPTIHKRITTDDIRVNMLTSIKGISEKKAKGLLKQFGSVMELGECSIEELCFVNGMGETVAKRLIKILNTEKRVIQ